MHVVGHVGTQFSVVETVFLLISEAQEKKAGPVIKKIRKRHRPLISYQSLKFLWQS